MNAYRLTPAAEDDLFEIWAFIASDNPTAADRLESELFRACQRLAEKPDLGHFRRDLTDLPVRFFAVRGTYQVQCQTH
jgi:plasmid stabilization system protein ParE